MDETNFNLFCRRGFGWARQGSRAVAVRPSSKGPNVHLIGAISTDGKEHIQMRRGSFTAESASDFVVELARRLRDRDLNMGDVVLICDNAPCHARLQTACDAEGIHLLRLAPYSPALNPIENVWSAVKAAVKRENRVPVVQRPGVMEQRLQYLEQIVERSTGVITPSMCGRAIQHSTTFHDMATEMQDMPVGA